MRNIAKNGHVQTVARAGPAFRAVAGVALALLALAVLAGCGNPTKPKDVKYNIYIGASNWFVDPAYSKIYIYDADSLMLIDSFPQTHFIDELAVSLNGQWLYIRDRPTGLQPATFWKIDARTKQVVWSRTDEVRRNGKAHIRILRNGELLLVGNDVLRPEDGSLVRHLNDSLLTRYGPVSGTKVAAIVRSSLTNVGYDSILQVLDVATGEVSGRYVARLSTGEALQQIFTARLHPDGRRVLAIGVYGSTDYSWFVVGDVVTGQTLFEYRIHRPRGEIAISSDGNMAALTDPGITLLGEGGVLRIIDLRTLLSTPPSPPVRGGQVRFLPGDRRIIVAPLSDFAAVGPMQTVDLATLTLERTIQQPIEAFVGGLDVGPRP